MIVLAKKCQYFARFWIKKVTFSLKKVKKSLLPARIRHGLSRFAIIFPAWEIQKVNMRKLKSSFSN